MLQVLKAEPATYSPESIQQAARILRAGGVAVFPTETVYGVGADIRDAAAVGRVFALKNREPVLARTPGLDIPGHG